MTTPATHTVSTDALATLGTIIDPTAGRDAIHLAVEPVKAGEKLYPGQHISLKDGVASSRGDTIGIVDPFLPGPVQPDQMFWFVIYPRQITSLRHVWEHPAFPPADVVPLVPEAPEGTEADRSNLWIAGFAARIDQTPNRVMQAAEEYLDSGEYTYDNTESYKEHWGEFPEFWRHFEIVTGRAVPEEEKGQSFFTCSC